MYMYINIYILGNFDEKEVEIFFTILQVCHLKLLKRERSNSKEPIRRKRKSTLEKYTLSQTSKKSKKYKIDWVGLS